MLELEVLVVEAGAIDAFTTSSITVSEVTTLSHEARNNSVEVRALEVKSLSSVSDTFLTGAKSTDILSGLRNSLAKEAEDNTSSLLTVNFDIKEDLAGNLIDGVSRGEGGGGSKKAKQKI